MAVRKKKAKVRIPRRTKQTMIVEEKHVGVETTDWSNGVDEAKVMETLRHYNYFYDLKTSVKWAKEWVKKNRSKTDYKNFSAAEDWRVSLTLAGLLKMMLNGAEFDERRMEWIDIHVNEVIIAGKIRLKEKKDTTKTTHRKSPAELVKERSSEFIGEIECIVDEWIDHEKTYSVYDEMKKVDLPYISAKAVHDYYGPVLEELEELTTKKTKDLVEAYSYMGGIRVQKRFMKFIKSIVDGSEMYMNSKKATRKPRAKKSVSSAQQVAKVNYQKECKEYQIVSIDPVNIVGATQIILFNTKYRTVTFLNSSSKSGFTVKGTTIQDIDNETSSKKKVRKPEPFLKEVAKTTKLKTKKAYEALKTKASEANGRIGKDTIILKAYG